jgi:hypothetical protein
VSDIAGGATVVADGATVVAERVIDLTPGAVDDGLGMATFDAEPVGTVPAPLFAGGKLGCNCEAGGCTGICPAGATGPGIT